MYLNGAALALFMMCNSRPDTCGLMARRDTSLLSLQLHMGARLCKYSSLIGYELEIEKATAYD